MNSRHSRLYLLMVPIRLSVVSKLWVLLRQDATSWTVQMTRSFYHSKKSFDISARCCLWLSVKLCNVARQMVACPYATAMVLTDKSFLLVHGLQGIHFA